MLRVCLTFFSQTFSHSDAERACACTEVPFLISFAGHGTFLFTFLALCACLLWVFQVGELEAVGLAQSKETDELREKLNVVRREADAETER